MNVILEPMIFCPWRKIFLVQKIESSKNISERKEFWKKIQNFDSIIKLLIYQV